MKKDLKFLKKSRVKVFLYGIVTYLCVTIQNKAINNTQNFKIMPQFNIHSPKSQSDMKAIRENSRKPFLPIGLISENHNFSYGFNGDYYYVAESAFGYLVTRMQLAFEEAKQLFNALIFAEASEPKTSDINNLIKSSRKEGLSGDNLFWFYVDGLSL